MLNKCCFIGRLGRDPEVRALNNGGKVATLNIGVSEKYKDKQGQVQEKTEWVTASVWGNLADVVEKYMTKGMMIYAEGQWRTEQYTDKDGNERYTTKLNIAGNGVIKMLSGGGNGGNGQPQGMKATKVSDDNFDDMSDIPF